MKVNICASLVSLPAFVVSNVCDNVRLQYLQDCYYYGIQEKGNCSRGCMSSLLLEINIYLSIYLY